MGEQPKGRMNFHYFRGGPKGGSQFFKGRKIDGDPGGRCVQVMKKKKTTLLGFLSSIKSLSAFNPISPLLVFEVALYNHSEEIWEFCLLKPGKFREYRGHFQVETLIRWYYVFSWYNVNVSNVNNVNGFGACTK